MLIEKLRKLFRLFFINHRVEEFRVTLALAVTVHYIRITRRH